MKKLFTFLCAALMSVGMFADINLTITQKPTESYSPGDDWVELSMHSEEGVDVTLYLAGITEMALGTSYNLGDMDSWSKISISGTDYELSDALITKTMNDGLVRYAGFVADYNSNRYNFDYQEQPAPQPAATVVTITDSDFPMSGQSFTKDGVTVSAGMIDSDEGNLMAGGSFSTTLGNFTQIEVNAMDVSISGEGWSGNSQKKTWTGNASSVSFSGEIMGMGMGTTLKFTIEEPAPTTYTLQLVADPEKGSVAVTNLLGSDIIDNGNGNYTVPENASVTILATPLEGYEFTGWKVGNIDEMVGCYYCGTALNTEDNPLTFTMTADVAYLAEFEAEQPQVERELTKLGFNFPSENIPADNDIEMAGTFEEGTMWMEKIIATGWFVSYDFVNAAEDETFKLRSKSNNDLVLCQFIPANDGEVGKWVQAIFTFGNYWSDDTWKGTPCKLIEEDLSDAAQYAWMEGMPEPEPEPQGETITVTWNSYDLPSYGSSFTKDGVTLTCYIDDSDLYGPGTFTTDLGNFTQIVVSAYDFCYIEATGGWSGDINQKTWTGNAASVSFNGNIYAYSTDVTIVFTIEPKGSEPTAVENVQTNQVQATKFFRDGMLLIERDGKIYNVQGVEVR